jgi:ankyrin
LTAVQVVAALLAAGADAGAATGDGVTPLHAAAAAGHAPALRLLLAAAGANPQAENKLGLTPLHLAAGGNHVEAVRLLLDQQPGLAQQPAGRYGALHAAAAAGAADALALLLERGAQATPDHLGRLPAHYAAMGPHRPCLALLAQAVRAPPAA